MLNNLYVFAIIVLLLMVFIAMKKEKETFYDYPANIESKKPVRTFKNGNCDWKIYKKSNYYGLGTYGYHYGEPYYMRTNCIDGHKNAYLDCVRDNI